MNEADPIECREEFMNLRQRLWNTCSSLIGTLKCHSEFLTAELSSLSAARREAIAIKLTYDLMTGDITDKTAEHTGRHIERLARKSCKLSASPCLTEWFSRTDSSEESVSGLEELWKSIVDLRTRAFASLADVLARHLPIILQTMQREIAGSLKSGATANDVTSLAFAKIQQRLLDGRAELRSHPEFRTYCRNCAKDIVRKLSRRVLQDADDRFEVRMDQEAGLPTDVHSERGSRPNPERAASLDVDFGSMLEPSSQRRSPEEYLHTQELRAWVEEKCSRLNPHNRYLLRRRTIDGLTFDELAQDPTLNPDGSRTPGAIEKQYYRLLKQLRDEMS